MRNDGADADGEKITNGSPGTLPGSTALKAFSLGCPLATHDENVDIGPAVETSNNLNRAYSH
jgi:hypothetical protein